MTKTVIHAGTSAEWVGPVDVFNHNRDKIVDWCNGIKVDTYLSDWKQYVCKTHAAHNNINNKDKMTVEEFIKTVKDAAKQLNEDTDIRVNNIDINWCVTMDGTSFIADYSQRLSTSK